MGLVIERKVDESFTIDHNTKITIIKVRSGGRVRVHIDAPPNIQVCRDNAKQRIPKLSHDLPTHIPTIVYDLSERRYYNTPSDIFLDPTEREYIESLGLKHYDDIDLLDPDLVNDPYNFFRLPDPCPEG